jgi:hypothetical protein
MIIEMSRPELPAILTITEFAEILFASGLQESDAPSAAQVCAAVCRGWAECGGDCSPFVARLAQEAGDHPEQAARRMRWARRTAEVAVGLTGLIGGRLVLAG